MNFASWEPFTQADALFRRFGNVRPDHWQKWEQAAGELPDWTPTADVTESDGEFRIEVPVPGVRPGDIWVRVENGVLKVRLPKAASAVVHS